jgi:hypothetical protein
MYSINLLQRAVAGHCSCEGMPGGCSVHPVPVVFWQLAQKATQVSPDDFATLQNDLVFPPHSLAWCPPCVAVSCRLGTISLLFLPVIGWVGFNILQPALNQLNRQNEIKEEAVAATGRSSGRKKRGVAGAVGLGAALSLFAAQNADAATELSQLAASDNRCAWFDVELVL